MKYINVPGLYNSGPEHWQTKWEETYPTDFIRVQQDNWNSATKEKWVHNLQAAIATVKEPMILIGHSLGAITIRHWLEEFKNPLIRAVLLVAPADVECTALKAVSSFAPIPKSTIQVRGFVVASTNDPYVAIERTATWAAYWGSRFISVGNKGHINALSGIGYWEEGWNLLQELKKPELISAG
ncbi:alpha/beta hydrolase [Flavihumibacter sp. CACIAM 22H1]|uniref:RBBP9/YdeN family alpha/beta hydrolase n=1 Tax=Flavihumibacter sp. CACIAM 22H1 TaxID=1812911 RepID=UPI0007A8FCE1|nr:alpha/beta hydrolase [Flavihumibacter sp. CACIAM 22H1]KYP15484.1 MAG: hypothetical protein A1D16_08295 [Flavihumibacter sp. CACIAM 22H1]